MIKEQIFQKALQFLDNKNIPSLADKGYIAKWMVDFASEIHQKQEEQLKRCWLAGVEYGSNRTNKNFNDFKQQEEK